MFLPIAWICCRNRLFLCCNSVVLPYIAETELCVATDSFHVATESSLLLIAAELFVETLNRDKHALAPPTYLPFSVMTENFSIVTEIFDSAAFIITT